MTTSLRVNMKSQFTLFTFLMHIHNYQGTFSELWLTFWQGSLKVIFYIPLIVRVI